MTNQIVLPLDDRVTCHSTFNCSHDRCARLAMLGREPTSGRLSAANRSTGLLEIRGSFPLNGWLAVERCSGRLTATPMTNQMGVPLDDRVTCHSTLNRIDDRCARLAMLGREPTSGRLSAANRSTGRIEIRGSFPLNGWLVFERCSGRLTATPITNQIGLLLDDQVTRHSTLNCTYDRCARLAMLGREPTSGISIGGRLFQ